MKAKIGQKVRVTNHEFGYFSLGSICECMQEDKNEDLFRVVKGISTHEAMWWMDEEDYEIIQEPETINPSMVVISWADWLEYQNLKNK
jgi:hypothetical protein